MSTIDLSQPFTIHLGVDEPQFERFEDDALMRGMMIFRLDLTDLTDDSALADYLAQEFMYPFKTAGLDAAVSLISDLEWFGNTNGYLVIARGLTNPSTVGDSFVSILPNITDRWRTGGQSRSLSPSTGKAMNSSRRCRTRTTAWMSLLASRGLFRDTTKVP